MTAFQVVWRKSVQYLDTPLEPQLNKPNGLRELGRHMGESPDTHGILAVVPLIGYQR